MGAKAQIEKTSLGQPSITDFKVKTLFGRNKGCGHSPGVCVLLRVCAPRIPLCRRNHWIIKPADANRGEQYHRRPSEGESSEARLGETRQTNIRQREEVGASAEERRNSITV